jgi:hypothetical protein
LGTHLASSPCVAFGHSSCQLASVLGTPLANSPCVPSGNPKFFPHHTSVTGPFGFLGWALLLPTHSILGAPLTDSPCFPSGNPKFFPHLGAPLGDSPRFWAPLWPTRLAFPLETPSFLPTTPLSLALWVLLVGRSSWRLASVLGAPLADSPCVPSGNPKFSPHHTSVAGSFGFVGWALLLATRLGFGHPSGRLALRSLWKPQVFSPLHLCRWLFGFCWLGTPLGNSPRFWAPLWPTRLAFPLETPSFLPTAPLSLALWVLLVGRSSWRLASVLGAPLADSPCVPSGNPKFSPHRTSVAGSLGFVGWALLLVTRLGFGRPSGRLALRSLWKPQVFSPPHLCRWLFGFCWLGAPLADSPRFWAPLWPTRLAFPLETPSFLPTAPLSLALWVLLVGRSSWRLASVLGAPLADSPCVPSGNPKFSPHRTSVAGSLGFVGWALLLATRLGFGRPSGRLALRSLWKPQVFSPPHLCHWLFGFCWLGAPLGDSPQFWAPLWPTRLAFPLETPSFLPTAPLSLALWVLLVGRSSWRLASVLGAPLADSPCVPSGNPKFSPHHTSVIWLFGFCWLGAPLGDSPRFWVPLWPTRLAFPLETPSFLPTAPLSLALWVLLVGRSSWRLASVLGAPLADSPCVPSGNPKFSPHRTSVADSLGFLVGRSSWQLTSVLGAPLPTRLAFPLETPSFLPTAPLSLALWVLLVGRSSWRLASVLGAPLADSPCVPSGNPKFSPHRTSVACSFGFVGWALLLPTRLGFGRPFRRLALRSLWKPQVFPHRTSVAGSFGFVGWALLLVTRLSFGHPFGRLALRSLWKPQVFSPPHLCRLFFRFCWLGAPLGDSPRFWAPLWPTRLAFPLETPSFFPTAPLSLFFRFCWLGAPLGHSPRFWAPLWPTRLVFPLETPSFFPTAPLSLFFRFCWLGTPLATRLGFGRPFGRLALCSLWKPQVFSPPRLCRCSFSFVGWALLLPTRLSFGRPFGRLALRSIWKPQVFSPPRLCHCSFGFVGWALLLATRLGFGHPFGRLALCSLWKPQVFSPPCLSRCCFGFVGWALLLPTRLGFGCPFRQLALLCLWKPQVFSPMHLCRRPPSVLLVKLSSCQLALVLGAPLANCLTFPLETPSFFPTAPLSLSLSV